MSIEPRTPADDAALGLDPARIVAEHHDRVREALDRDPGSEAAREAVESYADVEERVLLDVAERVLPEADDQIESAREGRARVLDALTARRRRRSARALFDQHVDQTEGMFRALWNHLDADTSARVAAALEEARLSREEGEPPRPARDDSPT